MPEDAPFHRAIQRLGDITHNLFSAAFTTNIAESNFRYTLAVKQWSLTSLREKLVKIGAKVVRHGRYVIFQMAEVAVPRGLFHEILRLIAELRPQPPPAPA